MNWHSRAEIHHQQTDGTFTVGLRESASAFIEEWHRNLDYEYEGLLAQSHMIRILANLELDSLWERCNSEVRSLRTLGKALEAMRDDDEQRTEELLDKALSEHQNQNPMALPDSDTLRYAASEETDPALFESSR
jgi:hypothetical protein